MAWGADEVPFPNKITLYRIPLEADHPDPASWRPRYGGPSSTNWPTTWASTKARMDDLGLE